MSCSWKKNNFYVYLIKSIEWDVHNNTKWEFSFFIHNMCTVRVFLSVVCFKLVPSFIKILRQNKRHLLLNNPIQLSEWTDFFPLLIDSSLVSLIFSTTLAIPSFDLVDEDGLLLPRLFPNWCYDFVPDLRTYCWINNLYPLKEWMKSYFHTAI